MNKMHWDNDINCRKYVCEHEKEVIEFFRNEWSDERFSEDDEFCKNYITLYDDYRERLDKW